MSLRPPRRRGNGMSPTDRFIMLLAGFTCAALTVEPVLLAVGRVAVPGIALVSFVSPYGGLIFLAASQIISDVPGLPLTPGQFAFLGFAGSVLYQRYEYRRSLSFFKRAAIPYASWILILDLLHGREFHTSAYLPLVDCACACVLLSHKRVRTDLALLAICIGSAVACASWWGNTFGIEIAGADLTRRGLQRLVTGRLAGISGFPSALAALGCLGLATWPHSPLSRGRARVLLFALASVSALSIPGTMGRGALLALVGGTVLLLGYNLFFLRRQVFETQRRTAVILVMCVGITALALSNDRIHTYLSRVMQMTRDQTREMTSTEKAIKSGYRTADMAKMVYFSLLHPLTGMPDDEVNDTPWGRGNVWQLMNYVPHNVFLNRAMSYGLPGMCLFVYFFFCPLYRLIRRRRDAETGTLAACHSVFFVLFMLFPFGGLKTFYVLWALESRSLLTIPAEAPNRQRPGGSDGERGSAEQQAEAP